jgi:hypothetical protein
MPRRRRAVEPTGLPLVDGLAGVADPTLQHYIAAASEYVLQASSRTPGQLKAGQIRLSKALAEVALADLRRRGLALTGAVAGERDVGGGLRTAKADVSHLTETDGLTLAFEIKPVHLAVGRAIWNRFGDIRAFAVNIHLKFPFAVVGGVMTVPTKEREESGRDDRWRPTTDLVARAVERFIRAGGRKTEGDPPHLLEGIAVVVFDPDAACPDPGLPPVNSGLRWEEFIDQITKAYSARFG